MSTKRLTFFNTHSTMDDDGDCEFQSNNKAAFTLYTNETLDASNSVTVNIVLLDLRGSNISIGLFPADRTDDCQNNRVGSAGLPGSVACRIGNGRVRVISNGTTWSDVSCDSNAPVLVKITVTNGIVSFFVDDSEVECPQLAENPLHGQLRAGVSTEASYRLSALAERWDLRGKIDSMICSAYSFFYGVTYDRTGSYRGHPRVQLYVEGGGGDDDSSSDDDDSSSWAVSDDDIPETGPLYTDTVAQSFKVDTEGPIAALSPTVFRCNEARDGTVYVPVPLCTDETSAIGVSVRFTGIRSGYVGCGFVKKEAIDAGNAHRRLVGQSAHSIGCLLLDGEVFVLINCELVFYSATPNTDELTMHFSFDHTKGIHVRVEKRIVRCDEFKDLSLFTDDLYFGISLSEAGQLAQILPSGLGAPRFHYGMHSMDVDEDKLMTCKHSVRASLSGHERWYGDAEKVFVMRITNVCSEPIGIGLVSARLWDNGRKNIVGSNAFSPHSVGLLIKDRRIYVHFQDEFVQWKPLGRMPPIPKNVDLMMRVSHGKVSFFYQGVPVILPVLSELTLPADERFRAAYSMSDNGQTAVIPPNVPVRALASMKNRNSFLGDATHVQLTNDNRSAKALFAGALCFSSEAFAITDTPWRSYPRGCAGCQPDTRPSGTLWLCAACGAETGAALCDSCYWNEELASQHEHDRSQFIPLFGAGVSEMHLTVDDAKDSYLEVGVAPASYADAFGAFAPNTSVVLGKATDLVKAAMPAVKFADKCPTLKNGDKVRIRVVDAKMSALVNDSTVFSTALSADEPFMNQPLRFCVRMGCADQAIRVAEA